MKKLALFVVLGAAALAAACSNANDGMGTCQTSQAQLPVLLYPAPNSIGVTDNPQFVAVYGLGGAGGFVNLVPTSGSVITSGSFVLASPGPLPSPAASAPPGATINSAPIKNLQSQTTYVVDFVHNPQPPCGPQQPSGTIGQFTTQ